MAVVTADLSPYDSDPVALAWARAKVQALEDRYRILEAGARGSRRTELAARFRWVANEFRTQLIGNGGRVIAAFDARRASLPPAPDGESG